MKNIFKRVFACMLGAAILGSGAVFLSACNNKPQAEPDITVNLTQETTAAVITPAPKPSAATGTMAFNGEPVTATEFDFYYYTLLQNYEQYVSYGVVPTTAEGTFDLSALCSITGYTDKSWGDALLAIALTQVQDMHILEAMAIKEGMTLTDDNKTSIASYFTSLESNAQMTGMEVDPYLMSLYGTATTKTALEPILSRYFLASQYMEKVQASFTLTDEELQAFYTENAAAYTDANLPVVRHILFMAMKGIEGSTDATEEEMTKAKANADAALAKINTYEDMIAVGDAALLDGTASEATEYTVQKDQMVAAFDSWCFDAARQVGDKAVVQTEYGYHVMYFVGSKKDWYDDAVTKLKGEKYSDYMKTQEALPEFALTVS